MPKVLVIRYEGHPFHVRMSKVLRTILDAGWECDVLIPENGLGTVNVSREMGRDLANEVRLLQFPHQLPRSIPERLAYRLSATGFFGTRKFRDFLTDLLSREAYNLVWVKDTPTLPLVFQAAAESGHPPVRIVCDMYENMSAHIYDTHMRYGRLHDRALLLLSRAIQRVRRIEREYLPLCDRVFVVVGEAKAYLVRRYPIDPDRVTVVHNVEILDDFDSIEPGEPLLQEDLPLLSFVGGFGPYRGIETLLSAVAALKSRGETGFRLALVGAPAPELQRLRALCEERGISDLVLLHGMLPHREAMRWMKQSNVGIIPHVNTLQIRTTIPNKLFQYMSGGAACITSDVGPLGRIVRETNCGLTFEPGDANDLARKIAFLLSDPEKMRELGRNGRSSAENKYRWEIEGRQYARYLRSLSRD